jgi:hypothetical protein
MSKHRRHTQKQPDISRIEWLKHRTGYPSPEEREKIIRMRQELLMELAMLVVTGIEPDDSKIPELTRKYRGEEVERAIQIMGETIALALPIAEDAKSYRDYRQRFARFGAGLTFYTAKEIEELHDEHLKAMGESGDFNQESEIDKLLLHSWRDWEDITPPAVPPRPNDFPRPNLPRIPRQSMRCLNGVMTCTNHISLRTKRITRFGGNTSLS